MLSLTRGREISRLLLIDYEVGVRNKQYQGRLMIKDASEAADQRAILSLLRASLRRYAFVFTAIGAFFTGANVIHQMYIRSIERATMLSLNPTLVEKQELLRKNSDGGKDYKIASNKSDDFAVALAVLMNYYEATANMVENYALIGPVVRGELKCPLNKHAKIFLLGQSREGSWKTDGAFFTPDQYKMTRKLYKSLSDADRECAPAYK